eukprot:COSAG01_NODE_3190_length_6440_cov_60.127425_7_plen_116_part_00
MAGFRGLERGRVLASKHKFVLWGALLNRRSRQQKIPAEQNRRPDRIGDMIGDRASRRAPPRRLRCLHAAAAMPCSGGSAADDGAAARGHGEALQVVHFAAPQTNPSFIQARPFTC